jgi:regulator of sigma E protease
MKREIWECFLSDKPRITQINPVQYSVPEAALMASKETWRLSKYTVIMLGDVVASLVQKLAVPDTVGGPVAIAQVTHMFVNNEGFIELFKLAALLSISIAVINIMPFPALDGGRLVFLLFEMITRKRPSPQIETAIHGVGFMLLMALILIVTWKDLGLPSIPAMVGLG